MGYLIKDNKSGRTWILPIIEPELLGRIGVLVREDPHSITITPTGKLYDGNETSSRCLEALSLA